MSILARVALWNNKFPLPPSPFQLMYPTDESLRNLIDKTLFTETYFSQWAPAFVRLIYYKQLREWRWECMKNYYAERLDIDKKNSYIGTTVEPYTTVLRYLVHQCSPT